MVYIECMDCGYKEEANKELFFRLLGGGFVGGGSWAWVSYLFAGTGFAFAICAAIVAGGVALLAFSGEITAWIAKKYDCPKCGKRNWRLGKE